MTKESKAPSAKEYVLSKTTTSLNNMPMYVCFEKTPDLKVDGVSIICVEKFDYQQLEEKLRERDAFIEVRGKHVMELADERDSLKVENERLKVVLHEAVTLADHNLKCYQAVCGDLTKLRKAVDVVRGELKFYGDKKNYKPSLKRGVDFSSDITEDVGVWARQALSEAEKILGETDDAAKKLGEG